MAYFVSCAPEVARNYYRGEEVVKTSNGVPVKWVLDKSQFPMLGNPRLAIFPDSIDVLAMALTEASNGAVVFVDDRIIEGLTYSHE